MKFIGKNMGGILILLTAFLALTGFLGGVGLIAKLNAPPVEQLKWNYFQGLEYPRVVAFCDGWWKRFICHHFAFSQE